MPVPLQRSLKYTHMGRSNITRITSIFLSDIDLQITLYDNVSLAGLGQDNNTLVHTKRFVAFSPFLYLFSVKNLYHFACTFCDSFSDWIASVSGSHKQSPLTLWDLFVCRLQNRFRFSRFTDGKSSPVVSSDDRDAQQNPGESPPRERESPTPTSPVRWAQYNLTYLESTLLMHPKLIAFADDSCSRGTGADSIESCPIGFDSQSLLDNLQASGVWRG